MVTEKREQDFKCQYVLVYKLNTILIWYQAVFFKKNTEPKMKDSVKNIFSKCEQTHKSERIC